MTSYFAETLKGIRAERKLTQKDLADMMYVTRPTVVRWESGSRLPDAVMMARLAQCLNVDVGVLLSAAAASDDSPHVIVVDDRKIVLSGALPVLGEVMPYATVTGFTRPSEAVTFAQANRVSLAFLDIELGNMSGLELCRTLLDINPRINVVYLTAYVEYSFDAWGTGASGFMLKPITADGVRAQLKNLRHPFASEGMVV